MERPDNTTGSFQIALPLDLLDDITRPPAGICYSALFKATGILIYDHFRHDVFKDLLKE